MWADLWRLLSRNRRPFHEEVAYAAKVAAFYLENLPVWGVRPDGAHVLEVGPGAHFGTQLLLVDYGARVTVADRYLPTWNDRYHPAFYRALRQAWGASAAIDRVLSQGGYDGVISCVPQPGEAMPSIASESFDLVLSNAVLEHVSDFAAVACELYRVSRPGSVQSHQIDFRDHHKNFRRPLDFLARHDGAITDKFVRSWGNRVRPSEARAMFAEAGFEIVDCSADIEVDPAYLESFVPKLRASKSRYRNWPAEDLKTLGARFVLRKPRKP
jgi:SAM-dependent methyltransferase